MKRFVGILLFVSITVFCVSCGDDETTVALCNCAPDQYCVYDTCYDTDDTVIPAPEEIGSSK